jgi:hypothetical protein
MPSYRAIRPYTAQKDFPGHRFVVERLDGETLIEVREEKTLPERVEIDHAQRIAYLDRLLFDPDEALWLFERLAELLFEPDRLERIRALVNG